MSSGFFINYSTDIDKFISYKVPFMDVEIAIRSDLE